MLGLQIAVEVAVAEVWLRLWWLHKAPQGPAAEKVNFQLWALWTDKPEWLEPVCLPCRDIDAEWQRATGLTSGV